MDDKTNFEEDNLHKFRKKEELETVRDKMNQNIDEDLLLESNAFKLEERSIKNGYGRESNEEPNKEKKSDNNLLQEKDVEKTSKRIIEFQSKDETLDDRIHMLENQLSNLNIKLKNFSNIIHGLDKGILVIDKNFKILFANKFHTQLSGANEIEAVTNLHCYETLGKKSICSPCIGSEALMEDKIREGNVESKIQGKVQLLKIRGVPFETNGERLVIEYFSLKNEYIVEAQEEIKSNYTNDKEIENFENPDLNQSVKSISQPEYLFKKPKKFKVSKNFVLKSLPVLFALFVIITVSMLFFILKKRGERQTENEFDMTTFSEKVEKQRIAKNSVENISVNTEEQKIIPIEHQKMDNTTIITDEKTNSDKADNMETVTLKVNKLEAAEKINITGLKPAGENVKTEGQPMKFLMKEDYSSASKLWFESFKEYNPENYTVLIEVDCLSSSIKVTALQLEYSENIFIIPKKVKNKDCYSFCYGNYSSTIKASSDLAKLRNIFSKQQYPPVLKQMKELY